MVPPFPSKLQRQSLSMRLSYSQLSFHTELVPYSRTFSFRSAFQFSLVESFVKSTNMPFPPHQVPIPGSSLSLALMNISFSFISSSFGWIRSIPGFTFGDTQTPLFFIWTKKSFGSLKRFLFQVNVQRFTPSSVSTAQYPEESWNPSTGIPSSFVVSINSVMASSQSASSSG